MIPSGFVKRYARRGFYGLICGILSGVAAALFLISLQWVTDYREAHPFIIWCLPLAGLLIGWLYHRFGAEAVRGHNLILDEIHEPQKIIPVRMAPLILFSTLLTHLFGGSAGREGTAVQMGASLSDQISRFFKIEPTERKFLLMAGAGAGFGAAIGTPLAGIIFGMEFIRAGRLKIAAWFECTLASFTAYYTSKLLQAPHSQYPGIVIPDFNFKFLTAVIVAGIFFGIAAFVFIKLAHGGERIHKAYIKLPYLSPFIAGILLVLLFKLEGSDRYVGLGIPVIQESLQHATNFFDPLFKTFFTVLTVGSGFKGGEFIPLVFIGSTLGNALSALLPASGQFLAALGFAAVFGGAANTPIACSIMAAEIFGPQILPYALVACFISRYVSGKNSIYAAQR